VGLVLAPQKCLEAKGTDNRVSISLSPSLVTSVGKARFVFGFLFPRLEPATCASVGVVRRAQSRWRVAGVKMDRSYGLARNLSASQDSEKALAYSSGLPNIFSGLVW